MTMIKTASVCKTFRAKKQKPVTALNNISLSVEKGEVLCVIGPSGAGKTTLLRALTGLETIDEGQVYIKDKLIFAPRRSNQPDVIKSAKTNKSERRKILLETGMVFQRFNLFPHKTVLENVMLAPVNARKLPFKQAREKSMYILEKTGLIEKINSFPSQLSAGQQQRTAIARALAMEPEIMLFDEPTSSLDPELSGEVLAVIKQLALTGMTIIIVSHEIAFVREAADKAAFMHEGSILESGTADQVFNNPVNERTARFLKNVRQPIVIQN